jgi:hypothetical protein
MTKAIRLRANLFFIDFPFDELKKMEQRKSAKYNAQWIDPALLAALSFPREDSAAPAILSIGIASN